MHNETPTVPQALITGHSQGLGAALAGQLLAQGIPVLALARRRNAALAAAWPDLLTEVEVDLADAQALATWAAGGDLAAWLRRGRGMVLLVNNAGTLGPVGPLHQQDGGALLRAVQLNVATPLYLSAQVARHCHGLGRPLRIAHISSGAGRNAYGGWSVYGAGKAALDHHARGVALDAAQAGADDCRVVSIAPGVVDTPMQAEIRGGQEADFPMKARFVTLQAEGALSPPEGAARQVLAHLLGPEFGTAPVVDVRNLGKSPD